MSACMGTAWGWGGVCFPFISLPPLLPFQRYSDSIDKVASLIRHRQNSLQAKLIGYATIGHPAVIAPSLSVILHAYVVYQIWQFLIIHSLSCASSLRLSWRVFFSGTSLEAWQGNMMQQSLQLAHNKGNTWNEIAIVWPCASCNYWWIVHSNCTCADLELV